MFTLDEMIYDVLDHIPINTYTKNKVFYIVLKFFRTNRKQLPNYHTSLKKYD
ncbi:MAG: hypothetical protein LUG46_06355 [Erysipelotrichaceae bacterium]|nr:hypothetical protein [Erysipelotrichaceae bacterium]